MTCWYQVSNSYLEYLVPVVYIMFMLLLYSPIPYFDKVFAQTVSPLAVTAHARASLQADCASMCLLGVQLHIRSGHVRWQNLPG